MKIIEYIVAVLGSYEVDYELDYELGRVIVYEDDIYNSNQKTIVNGLLNDYPSFIRLKGWCE